MTGRCSLLYWLSTPGSFFSTFVVRVDGRAEDHLAAIRDTIQSLDPQVPCIRREDHGAAAG